MFGDPRNTFRSILRISIKIVLNELFCNITDFITPYFFMERSSWFTVKDSEVWGSDNFKHVSLLYINCFYTSNNDQQISQYTYTTFCYVRVLYSVTLVTVDVNIHESDWHKYFNYSYPTSTYRKVKRLILSVSKTTLLSSPNRFQQHPFVIIINTVSGHSQTL